LPPQTIQRVTALAQPLLPAVKERARAELPKAIRARSEKFSGVPFFLMVLGADRFFDISVTGGDTAVVKSKNADRPLELRMQRNGGQWQVVGIKDDQLATDIARKIGQEIIAVAMSGKNAADRFGIGNLSDMLRQAEELVR
jgi:hypothetical protein